MSSHSIRLFVFQFVGRKAHPYTYLCWSTKLELDPLRGGRNGALKPRLCRSGNGESLKMFRDVSGCNSSPGDLVERLRRRAGAGGRVDGSFFTVAYLNPKIKKNSHKIHYFSF